MQKFYNEAFYQASIKMAKDIENTFNVELNNAEILDENELPKDVVTIGAFVKVKDYEFDEEIEFHIVSLLGN